MYVRKLLVAGAALSTIVNCGCGQVIDDWEESTPEAEGMDIASLEQLDSEFRAGTHGNVDSMLIIRNGRIVYESYYKNDYASINAPKMVKEPGPYNYYDSNWHPFYKGSELHTLQSASKSVMSALVGIAIDRGDISGIDATLGELLPHRKIQDPRKAAISLENILKMQPGFEWEENVSYWDPRNDGINVEATDDWVAYLLAKPLVAEQGTVYKYNSTNTQLLSEIVSTASSMSLDKYAEKYLFGPIGITDYFWKTAPEGFKDVSGGIYLKPRDLARFALLFERDGKWNGNEIISKSWVRRSTSPYVPDTSPESDSSMVGYGYQWWVFHHSNGDAPDMYGGSGWGGQYPLVVPELNLVAVFTGWNVYEDADYVSARKLFYDRIVSTTQKQ
jgi:CubicO group peptidase (beta-lactamase class C family)